MLLLGEKVNFHSNKFEWSPNDASSKTNWPDSHSNTSIKRHQADGELQAHQEARQGRTRYVRIPSGRVCSMRLTGDDSASESCLFVDCMLTPAGAVFLVQDKRDGKSYVLKKVECNVETEANKAFKEVG